MAIIADDFLRTQLEERRRRLADAMGVTTASNASYASLLQEVDDALKRMETGTYGICDSCHEAIEPEHLMADPLHRFCIDHMSAAERRALENDLELAAQVQRALLPERDIRHCGWHIHYQYEPAGAVSGDYCDILRTENSEIYFLLGDVSGKGIAASLLMSHLHALFRTLTAEKMELGALLGLANRAFCESAPSGHYATLVCGRLEENGALEMAGAGHLPALAVQEENVVRSIPSAGLPLGMFCNSHYTSTQLQLRPREALVLYTDGLSEAHDGAAGEYGVGGIERALLRNRGLGPAELAQAVLADAREFAGNNFADDLTLMVLQHTA